MPPPLCNKCREVPAIEGDPWCLGCIGWESLGRELSSHWDSQGARLLANDLVISTTRQVRNLRSLSSGLLRSAELTASAGVSRAPAGSGSRDPPRESPSALRSERGPLDRKRDLPVPPPPIAKKEDEETDIEAEGEESSEESVQESDRVIHTTPKAKAVDHRSTSPPAEHHSSGHRSAGHSRAHASRRPRGHHRSKDREEKRKHSHRSRTRRAGRKHQRLARLADNPGLDIHRKASGSVLDLSSRGAGREALDRF